MTPAVGLGRLSNLSCAVCLLLVASSQAAPNIVPVGKGWAGNSVNAVVFRHNSVVSHADQQYVTFYDPTGHVVLAKRRLGGNEWQLRITQLVGDVRDAHNSISIMVDGAGYLHMAWNHHDDPLHYCRSIEPGSLELTAQLPMTGRRERRVTYPEFYRLPDGDLLFLYRDGESGQGNLVLNHYDCQTQQWTQRQEVLVDGQGERNAYWQMCVDPLGTLHLSWVWRETFDVATNHDLCYAKSFDGGVTWQRSDGAHYEMPITAGTAEYARRIPQGSDLMNSTSMAADKRGRPFIATYWRSEGNDVPQYQLVYHDGSEWRTLQVSQRTAPFSLRGLGTKRIPFSRPQVIVDDGTDTTKVHLVFRDTERGNRVSLASCDDLRKDNWRVEDLTDDSLDMWEPSYDTEVWTRTRQLHLFMQKVAQGDSERTEAAPPTQVSILEWTSPSQKEATP